MQGNAQVIASLNDILTAELTAINQYFIHARLCENWGYQRLWKKIREESIDEMKHADKLIHRILFLDGMPNVQRYNTIQTGQTVKEQLTLDLGLERDAIVRFNAAIELSRSASDNGSREMLEEMLVSEEEHADWLEEQLEVISQIGEANYLAQQIRE